VRDYGKQVYTFALRGCGKAVRVALKSAADRAGQSEMSRDERVQWLLSAPTEDVFDVQPVEIDLPDAAHIHQSITCEECGEMVVDTYARMKDGKRLCTACASE